MNNNVVTGIVIVLAIAVIGWWFWSRPAAAPAPTESIPAPALIDESMSAGMTGTWKSSDDAKFTRTFAADGTVTDRYEGEDSATISGEWSVIDPTKESVSLPVVKDGKVIKIQFPEEALYFAVTSVSETELVMTYLSGNGVLRFVRVQ